jgi:hypothetical protein
MRDKEENSHHTMSGEGEEEDVVEGKRKSDYRDRQECACVCVACVCV